VSRLIRSVLTHSILLRPVGRSLVNALLLETGEALLTEAGDQLALE
jgi:hypothetical protein